MLPAFNEYKITEAEIAQKEKKVDRLSFSETLLQYSSAPTNGKKAEERRRQTDTNN